MREFNHSLTQRMFLWDGSRQQDVMCDRRTNRTRTAGSGSSKHQQMEDLWRKMLPEMIPVPALYRRVWYSFSMSLTPLPFSAAADENPDEVYFQELPVWKRAYFWRSLWFRLTNMQLFLWMLCKLLIKRFELSATSVWRVELLAAWLDEKSFVSFLFCKNSIMTFLKLKQKIWTRGSLTLKFRLESRLCLSFWSIEGVVFLNFILYK